MHLITCILPLLTSLALAAPPPHGYNSTTSISAPSTATATATASASPSNCPVLLENTPWLLTNLTAFDPSPGHNGSFISFHFCDTNPGLELETTCSRRLNRFSSKSPVDADTYYACDDETVRFVYAGESLTVKRAFRDDWYVSLPLLPDSWRDAEFSCLAVCVVCVVWVC